MISQIQTSSKKLYCMLLNAVFLIIFPTKSTNLRLQFSTMQAKKTTTWCDVNKLRSFSAHGAV